MKLTLLDLVVLQDALIGSCQCGGPWRYTKECRDELAHRLATAMATVEVTVELSNAASPDNWDGDVHRG
jgi:hypothetical protein